jgi:hypothetical protein
MHGRATHYRVRKERCATIVANERSKSCARGYLVKHEWIALEIPQTRYPSYSLGATDLDAAVTRRSQMGTTAGNWGMARK